MRVRLTEPSRIDAIPQDDSYVARFYKGRKTAYMHLVESIDMKGSVVDSLLIKVSAEGKLSVDRLSEEITEEVVEDLLPNTEAVNE